MAVAFDAVGPSSSGAGGTSISSLSWTHTNVASGVELIVACSYDNASDSGVTMSATVDSVSISALTNNVESDSLTAGFARAFGTSGSASGARTVKITTSNAAADLEGGSVSFTGVGQLGTPVTASGTGTSASAVVAGTASSSLIFGFAAAGDSLTATTSPGVSRFVNNLEGSAGNATGNCAGQTSAGGGSVTVAWTVNSSAPWAAIAVEVQAPAGAASESNSALAIPPGLQSPMALAKPEWYPTAPQTPASVEPSPQMPAVMPPGMMNPRSLSKPTIWYPSQIAPVTVSGSFALGPLAWSGSAQTVGQGFPAPPPNPPGLLSPIALSPPEWYPSQIEPVNVSGLFALGPLGWSGQAQTVGEGTPTSAANPPGLLSPMALAPPQWTPSQISPVVCQGSFALGPLAVSGITISTQATQAPAPVPPGLQSPAALGRPQWTPSQIEPVNCTGSFALGPLAWTGTASYTVPAQNLLQANVEPPGLQSPASLGRPQWYPSTIEPVNVSGLFALGPLAWTGQEQPVPLGGQAPPALPPGLVSPATLAATTWYPNQIQPVTCVGSFVLGSLAWTGQEVETIPQLSTIPQNPPGLQSPMALTPPYWTPSQVEPVICQGSFALGPLVWTGTATYLQTVQTASQSPPPNPPGLLSPMALSPPEWYPSQIEPVVCIGSFSLGPLAWTGQTSYTSPLTIPQSIPPNPPGLLSPAALARPAFFPSSPAIVQSQGSFALAPIGWSGATAPETFIFPQTVMASKIELLLNGTWTDITNFVYNRNDITINRGRPNEATSIQPSSMTLILNNRGGRFSPKNPSGAYFPFLTRNTQIRVSVSPTSSTGQTYIGYRYWGEVSVWPPSWDPTGTDVFCTITANGVLRRLQQSAKIGSALYRYYTRLKGNLVPLAYWPCQDASGSTSFVSVIPGVPAGTWTGTPNLAADNNFGGSDAVSQLNGSSWTFLTGQTGNPPPSGSVNQTTPGTYQWTAPSGVSVVTGVTTIGAGGGGAGSGFSAGSGAGGGGENTQSSSVTVTPLHIYTYVVGSAGSGGTAANGGPGGDGGDSYFAGDSVTNRGHGGKGGHGSGSGGSGGTGGGGEAGGAGGGGGSTYGGGGGSSGGTSAPGNPGSAGTGSGPGSGGLAPDSEAGAGGGGDPDGQQGGIAGSTPGGGGGGGTNTGTYAGTGANGGSGQVIFSWTVSGGVSTVAANILRFLLDVPLGGGVDGAILVQMKTIGTISTIQLAYHTGGNLELIGRNSSGGILFDSGSISAGINGVPLVISIELTPNGTSTNWALYKILPGLNQTPVTVASGTVASTSIGSVTEIDTNVGGTDTGSTTLAHFAVQYFADSLVNVAAAAGGYAGELAATRFIRLCTELGIGFQLRGQISETGQMGPQQDDKLVNLLQTIEDFDRGQLFEARDMFGLVYRTRASMLNQSSIQYNYAGAQISPPLQPTADDQLIRNDVTLTRLNGSSARNFLASGTMSIQDPPNGVGNYSYSQTVVAFQDSQLPALVNWIVSLGTVDDYRYPQVTIDLARSENANSFIATASLDVGDFFEIINPPGFLTQLPIKQLSWGFTERINQYVWTFIINSVPEVPYEVISIEASGSLAPQIPPGLASPMSIGQRMIARR